MNDHERMLAFAVKWRHWNGGSAEDIFIEFGVDSTEFFRRLRQLLTGKRRPNITPPMIKELLSICDTRLRRAPRQGELNGTTDIRTTDNRRRAASCQGDPV
ncbi:hypothetical protein ACWEO2_36165 [Nocardia sp. NPDC004278]